MMQFERWSNSINQFVGPHISVKDKVTNGQFHGAGLTDLSCYIIGNGMASGIFKSFVCNNIDY